MEDDVSEETDVGLDAGHGRSPGGTGRLFPDATLPMEGGGSLSLGRYRARSALVVLMLGPGALAEPAARLLGQLADARAELEAEGGQVLVIVADAPERWQGAWPHPFPLAFDASAGLHQRVAAVDAAGRPDVALYITDRFREVFAVLRPTSARWPASAHDVIEWLTFIGIQCPECNPPEG
jgi:peroxiredoxin